MEKENKIKPIYLATENRTALQDVIPLDTPFSIYIDTSSLCNSKCKFCYQSETEYLKNNNIKFGLMSMETFDKIIEGLKGFPRPLKMAHLYLRGEPMLNKNLPLMIEKIKKSGTVGSTSITTNALLLDKEMADALIKAELDNIRISVISLSSEKYKEDANIDVDFNQLVENIKYFYQNKTNTHVYVKIADIGLTDEDKKFFYDTFIDYTDEIFIENIADNWTDVNPEYVEKYDKGMFTDGDLINTAEVCTKIFYSFVVNDNGDVTTCVGDWQKKFVVGNVHENTLVDIWNGETFNNFRKDHLRFERNKHDVCKGCKVLKVCLPDNIDIHAGEILKRFE